MLGQSAFDRVCQETFTTVLDIGCGLGTHSELFSKLGKRVTSIDLSGRYGKAIQANYVDYTIEDSFDCVWCCHVLEHQHNVQQFLRKIHSELRENGILAITVPPLKHEIVGGHVTLWNAGLLIYNLVLAGFDCKQAKIKTIDYDVSVILNKKSIVIPELVHDRGDIETLRPYFPDFFYHGVNGQIEEYNW